MGRRRRELEELARERVGRGLLSAPGEGVPPFPGAYYERQPRKVRRLLDELLEDERHVVVAGQTGSGKSYTCAVMVEELLERGVPVVVIDPHGEYLTLSAPNDSPSELAELRRLGLEPRGPTHGSRSGLECPAVEGDRPGRRGRFKYTYNVIGLGCCI